VIKNAAIVLEIALSRVIVEKTIITTLLPLRNKVKTQTPRPSRRRKGFSLVEILVTVTMIGVLVLGVVPMISSVFGQTEDATARSNARHLAQTAFLAVSAGSEPLLSAASKEDAVTLLRSGVYGGGEFATTRFQVALDSEAASAAMGRLTFANGLLTYGEP